DQSIAAMTHDLQIGQVPRDLTLVGVVIAVVIGLAVLNRRREREIRRSESDLDDLLEHAHDIVLVLDDDQRVAFASSAVTRGLGIDPRAWVGRPLADLVHPDDREGLRAAVRSTRGTRGSTVTDVRIADADGRELWFDVDTVDLHDNPGVRGVMVTCHEVGDRKALEDQLAYRDQHDVLTGLPNRSRFADALERLSEAGGARTFAVLFLDLDHFKPVNDQFGHAVGDEVLRQ